MTIEHETLVTVNDQVIAAIEHWAEVAA